MTIPLGLGVVMLHCRVVSPFSFGCGWPLLLLVLVLVLLLSVVLLALVVWVNLLLVLVMELGEVLLICWRWRLWMVAGRGLVLDILLIFRARIMYSLPYLHHTQDTTYHHHSPRGKHGTTLPSLHMTFEIHSM